MSEYKAVSQVDEANTGIWVFLPVKQIADEGSTFSTGNAGGRVTGQVDHFPGIGVVKFDASVRLKQPKAKNAPAPQADPAAFAAQVLAILGKRGVTLDAILPSGNGAPVTVPPGVSGSEIGAGRAAAGALLAAAEALQGSGVGAAGDRAVTGQDGGLLVPPSMVPGAAVRVAAEPLPEAAAEYQADPDPTDQGDAFLTSHRTDNPEGASDLLAAVMAREDAQEDATL